MDTGPDAPPNAPDAASGDLLVVGVNHRTAPFALRERLYLEPADLPRLLADIAAAGLGEACVIATCDRLDVIAVHEDAAAATDALIALLAARAELAPAGFRERSYQQRGRDALRHLFAVAASLDSQVIGEPQVLGQVKESHRVASAAGMVGPTLEAALQAAYAAAKRVRSETPVAQLPVSIVAAALLVARNLHGALDRCSGLLVGLGEMSEIFGRELREAGIGDLVVSHPSAARAEAAAHRLHCHFAPWDQLDGALAEADIVVAATGSGRFTITTEAVERALRRRRRRPVLFLDTAVPGDVDPAADNLDGAFVYDLGDLEGVAQQGKATREGTAVAAWRVVGQEIEAFLRQRAERGAAPAVSALRRHFEAVRKQVLSQGTLDADDATRLLVNRLLHDPSEALREAAAGGTDEGARLERTVERLFRLGRGPRVDDGKERL